MPSSPVFVVIDIEKALHLPGLAAKALISSPIRRTAPPTSSSPSESSPSTAPAASCSATRRRAANCIASSPRTRRTSSPSSSARGPATIPASRTSSSTRCSRLRALPRQGQLPRHDPAQPGYFHERLYLPGQDRLSRRERGRGRLLQPDGRVRRRGLLPRLTEDVFLQEAHRLELGEDGSLDIKGVVYNEMRGDYPPPSPWPRPPPTTSLFSPGHPYSFDSGGDPL